MQNCGLFGDLLILRPLQAMLKRPREERLSLG